MGAVPLRRVGGLATATWILALIVGAAALLGGVLASGAQSDAEDYLAGRLTEDEFVEAYAPAALLGLVQVAAMLALVVLTMIWMHRLASNHRLLQRVGTWSPGWAIGGWFLPPLVLYIIPFLMFRELWKASDPEVPVGDERWRTSSVSPIVPIWWVLYGLAPLVLLIVQGADSFGGLNTTDTESLAETLDDQATLSLLTGAVTAAAAIAYLLLVRGLTSRHRRLTGEAATG